jgi:hypothetical protein
MGRYTDEPSPCSGAKHIDGVAIAHGAWHMAHGTWHMAHGTWHMAHGTWHMAHGTWYEEISHQKCLTVAPSNG